MFVCNRFATKLEPEDSKYVKSIESRIENMYPNITTYKKKLKKILEADEYMVAAQYAPTVE